MCGIVGAIAGRDVVPVLIEGLKRLEYRGYDSSGIAVLDGAQVRRVRRTGRVAEMAQAAQAEQLGATLGIGHTRWATHGGVTEANAHPHISAGVALVHNGIIENHEAQREKLRALGYTFESQTDTEVIAHLIHHHLGSAGDLLTALQHTVKELTGAYALAVVSQAEPERFVCARMGCPLLIGVGEGENFVASDVSAIVQATRQVIFLEEGDTAELRRDGVRIFDGNDAPVERPLHLSDVSLASLELGPFRHFMQKEIHEQPRALADTIEAAIDAKGFPASLFGANAEAVLRDIEGVQILACGTSYYAGMTARYWIEAIAGLPCSVEIASEYRYRAAYANPKHLIVTISQSGETLDTMEALKYAKSLGHLHTLSICNVPESAIPRASELVCYTRAGAEIGVASTKAFTTQLAVLFQLTMVLGTLQGRISDAEEAEYLEQLRFLPGSVQLQVDIGLLQGVLRLGQFHLRHGAAVKAALVALQVARGGLLVDLGLVGELAGVGTRQGGIQGRAAGFGLQARQGGLLLRELAAQLGAVDARQFLALLDHVAGHHAQRHRAGRDGVQHRAVGSDHAAVGGDVAHQVALGDGGDAHAAGVER